MKTTKQQIKEAIKGYKEEYRRKRQRHDESWSKYINTVASFIKENGDTIDDAISIIEQDLRNMKEYKIFRFDYIGDDGMTYPGKYLLCEENGKIVLDSFGYYDPKTREWVDCDRGDVLPEEIQDAWENGKTIR